MSIKWAACMLGSLRRASQLTSIGLALLVATMPVAVSQTLEETVTEWETRLDARVGVALRHVSSNWEWAYQGDERFPMCSTFKSLLCGAVLERVDAGEESLTDHVMYRADDLVTYSPVTEHHAGTGMNVGELCEAAITRSDNTAANLLLGRVGGPAGLTAFLREIGDEYSRLDRWETELNESIPGDPRDTTMPSAIVATLARLLFGDVLSEDASSVLRQWMIETQTADSLIRASLPEGWEIGDKTGAGLNGSRGIVAFLVTPDDEAYVVAIYITETEADFSTRNEAIAAIGRAVIAEVEGRR